MSTPEQQKAWDKLIDDAFALDAEHPYLGDAIEPEDEVASVDRIRSQFEEALKRQEGKSDGQSQRDGKEPT